MKLPIDPCSSSHQHHTYPVPTGRPHQIVSVNAQTLGSEVLGRSSQVPVFVLIGAPLIPGFAVIEETLRELALQGQFRWILATVNSDTESAVVAKFRPSTLPALYAVVEAASVALYDSGDIAVWIDDIIARSNLEGLEIPEEEEEEKTLSTSDPRLLEAARLVDAGDFGAAIGLYDELLYRYPGDPRISQAKVAVSVLLRLQSSDRSVDPVALSHADPNNIDMALRAADVLVLFDRPEEALKHLLEHCDGSISETLRTRIIELCHLLAQGHPLVTVARQRLAMSLF